ncbi:DNA methylase [Porphyromonas gingivalis]|uniref:DNA methylase n=1 Tax=Porphyromonas gingivalis TaxID=837 RepID=UPI00097DE591|nr:DNA methylase [Porphyromonas gingivalis]ATR92320.1 DNA methylase [Porphyromonas gingivalis]ATS07683.1 DNA methylase [Porphyromonas gingivalis]
MQAAPQGGIYNYFHSLLPPLSFPPFMRRTPLPSISLFFKGLFLQLLRKLYDGEVMKKAVS